MLKLHGLESAKDTKHAKVLQEETGGTEETLISTAKGQNERSGSTTDHTDFDGFRLPIFRARSSHRIPPTSSITGRINTPFCSWWPNASATRPTISGDHTSPKQ